MGGRKKAAIDMAFLLAFFGVTAGVDTVGQDGLDEEEEIDKTQCVLILTTGQQSRRL